jgi:nucleoside-diphosphate-sugar epimerase
MGVLVTGAQGFVGLNVTRTLAEAGARVYALGRREPDEWVRRFLAPVAERVEYRVADLTQLGQLASVLADDYIEAVVHAAVVTATTPEVEREQAAWIVAVNTAGTIEVLEQAVAKGARRFVYVSSPSALGTLPSGRLPVDESVIPRPESIYGVTKLASERLTRRYGQMHGLSTVSVRIAQPYGPGERPTPSRLRTSPIYEWLRDASRGLRLSTGPLDRERDWTYIDETARGIAALTLADALPHDLYHLSYGRAVTVGAVIELLRGRYPRLELDEEPAPGVLNPNIAGPNRPPLNSARFAPDFGWSPEVTIAEGMSVYLDWWSQLELWT